MGSSSEVLIPNSFTSSFSSSMFVGSNVSSFSPTKRSLVITSSVVSGIASQIFSILDPRSQQAGSYKIGAVIVNV